MPNGYVVRCPTPTIRTDVTQLPAIPAPVVISGGFDPVTAHRDHRWWVRGLNAARSLRSALPEGSADVMLVNPNDYSLYVAPASAAVDGPHKDVDPTGKRTRVQGVLARRPGRPTPPRHRRRLRPRATCSWGDPCRRCSPASIAHHLDQSRGVAPAGSASRSPLIVSPYHLSGSCVRAGDVRSERRPPGRVTGVSVPTGRRHCGRRHGSLRHARGRRPHPRPAADRPLSRRV
jgi:hypothetical protein